jgi:hypothetical protein
MFIEGGSMDEETRKLTNEQNDPKLSERREALLSTGRLAVYAAPFTLMALTRKADAASGHGHQRRHS